MPGSLSGSVQWPHDLGFGTQQHSQLKRLDLDCCRHTRSMATSGLLLPSSPASREGESQLWQVLNAAQTTRFSENE